MIFIPGQDGHSGLDQEIPYKVAFRQTRTFCINCAYGSKE